MAESVAEPQELVALSQARVALAEARTLDGIRAIRDVAELARAYAKKKRLGFEIQNEAAEIKLRAERKLGSVLAAMPTAKGGAPIKHGRRRRNRSNDSSGCVKPPTLRELGLKLDEAAWSKGLALVPHRDFEDYLAAAKRGSAEVTAAGLRPSVREALREQRRRLREEREAKKEAETATQAAGGLVLTAERETSPAERSYSVAAWEKLSASERGEIIAAGFDCKTSMNDQPGDAIEWARRSLNTVTGCLHDCPYCYARDIANRLYPEKFAPTFHPSRLGAPGHAAPPPEARHDPAFRNIFANSMSDLFGQWVPRDWIEATIEMARRGPRWNFLVLTKFPQRAAEFDFPDNWWMGTTVDAQARVANAERAFAKIKCKTKWLSVEPLLQPLEFARLDLFQWLVIGGASASQKTPAWVPPLDWLAELHQAARRAKVRIYYKTNSDLPDSLRVREFPWSEPDEKKLPGRFRYLKGMG